MKPLPDREGLLREIIEVAWIHGEGYTRVLSNRCPEHEIDTQKKCAIAAHNTGWFIARQLGYSVEEITAVIKTLERPS